MGAEESGIQVRLGNQKSLSGGERWPNLDRQQNFTEGYNKFKKWKKSSPSQKE